MLPRRRTSRPRPVAIGLVAAFLLLAAKISASLRPAPSSGSSSSPSSPPSAIVVAFALVALIGIGLGRRLAFDQLEIAQQLADQSGEGGLVVESETERVEIAAGFLLDPVGDQIEARRARRAEPCRSAARAPSARRRGQGHLVAVAGAGERIGTQAQLGQAGEILAHPGHAACAERLAARLLGGVEHRPRRSRRWGRPGHGADVVMAQPQRRGIGEAARFGHSLCDSVRPGHRRLDRLAGGGGRIAGEADLDLGIGRDRPRRAGQSVAEGSSGLSWSAI
jgi:hypothetical protein